MKMRNFGKLNFIFIVMYVFQYKIIESVPVEPGCSKFSYDEQLLEKMVRMEFFVENMKKDVENSVSNVNDIMTDIKGNNSELSARFSEQQEKIENLENQTGVLDNTKANKDEISKCKDGISDLSKKDADLENQIKDLNQQTEKIQEIYKDGVSNLTGRDAEFEKQIKDLNQQTEKIQEIYKNGISDLTGKDAEFEKQIKDLNQQTEQILKHEISNCKDGISNLSKKDADLQKQINDFNQGTEKKHEITNGGISDLSKKILDLEKQIKDLKEKTGTAVAFNAMDAVSYTGKEAIKFSKTILNKGFAFSTSTGFFTAPVDGIYLFNAHICCKKGIEIEYFIDVAGTKIVLGEFRIPDGASDTKCTSFSAAALVRKDEKVSVGGMSFSELDRTFNSQGDSNNEFSSFSGTLIQAL